MQIRRILLRNLHSIRQEVEIDFMASPLAGSGLFAITGDTGAGKTTILDAITLALYGKICRNSNEFEALSHGAEEGFAACEFEAGNRRFLAQWSIRKRKSQKENNFKTDRMVAEWDAVKQEFFIRAERKVREIDAFVEEVTGLDFARFTRSVMLAQGDFAAFLKAPPKERSELLERITGTEIYSHLSIAALERYRIEQQLLEDLRKKRESLKVFSKEELKELKAILKQKEKDNKVAKTVLEETRQALLWLQKIATLDHRLAGARGESFELEEVKSTLQEKIGQLALHRKTLPLHPTLTRYDDKVAETNSLAIEIAHLESENVLLKEQEATVKAGFEEKRKAFEALKSSQPAAMRLFDEVGKLDLQITSRTEILAKIKQEAAGCWQQEKESLQEKSRLEKEAGELEASIKATHLWLKENAVWEALPKDLPAIRLMREQLRENLKSQQQVKEEQHSLEQKLEKAKASSALLQADLEVEKNALQAKIDLFKQTATDEYITDRNDLLEKLNREIESLGDRHKNFRQLNGLSEEYSQTLAELTHLEEQLDNLRSEERAIDKLLLSALEETEEWELQLKFKQENYRLHQQIANYEQDRANLKESDQCPLCFSTHHPFRQHHYKPFVNEAKLELEQVERIYQENQRSRNELLKRHYETALKIQQIDSSTTGQMGKLQHRLLEYERKMATLFPGLSEEEFSQSHGEWLLKKVAGFEENLDRKKSMREALATLNREIGQKEELARSMESQAKDFQYDIQHKLELQQEKQRMLTDLEKKFNQGTSELDKLVSKYDYSFSLEKANGMFTKLEAREKDFSNQKESLNEQEHRLGLVRQELKQLTKSLTDLDKKCRAMEADIAKDDKMLIALRGERLGLFGEKDPMAEREQLLEEIEQQENAIAEARAIFDKTKEALALNQQALKSRNERLLKGQKALEEIKMALETGLAKAGFSDRAALRAAILPEEEAAATEQQAEAIKSREIEIAQKIRDTQKELEATRKQVLTEKKAEELQAEGTALETFVQQVQQEMGGLQQQLKDNELRQAEAGQLLEEMEAQRKTYNRWAALYDLIGSSDGKKFRIFAQGLTLQKLVQLANAHLTNLFGRYVIMKRSGEDLELDIVDTYQADSVRSMHTLSGGESFLVSLALALGLSDLAGHSANIRSLFIDEGFGTLDEQTLDLAITTLENLQAKGKTIGIISHVKELKERIATQIRVLKKGGGTSVVEIVG